MRLIDTDEMNEKLFYRELGGKDVLITAKSVFDMIKALPTAYDVEKVVTELEKAKEECYVLEITTGEPYKYYCQRQAFENAIDIVKRGGVK